MFTCFVIPLVPVEIVKNPVNVTHFAGGTVSLSCSARGFPAPLFVWYKNGEQVLENERVNISNTTLVETPNEILTQTTLSLVNLNQSDDADYYCKAHNPGVDDLMFVTTSSLAHLSVQREQ